MSIQFYDFDLPANKNREVSAQGRYIYYLAGTTANLTASNGVTGQGNQALKVTPGNTGASIILLPGQSLRLPAEDKQPSVWRIENYKNAEEITGTVLIGEGDFHDSNTNNLIRLDASFANNVTVMNDVAHRVPVAIDTSSRLPVALDPSVPMNTAVLMTYTNSFNSLAVAAGGPTAVITAVQNVNGAIIEQICTGNAAAASINLLVKATVPANAFDGDVMNIGLPAVYTTRQKVAAGKAVWVWPQGSAPSSVSVLFTLL